MSTCKRLGKLIGGCRFEPRYHLGPIEISDLDVRGVRFSEFVDALRERTYVCDVCIRCGKTIQAPEATE